MSTRRHLGQIHLLDFAVAVSNNERAHGSDYRFTQLPARVADGRGLVVVPVEFKYLHTGDYSIVGHEDRVCVERKTLEDLFGTLGNGRERFSREFERMDQMDFAAVVIEANWHEIMRPADYRGDWRSKMNSRAVWATIFSWSQDFPHVHWFTMGSRRIAEMATFEILEMYWRKHVCDLDSDLHRQEVLALGSS